MRAIMVMYDSLRLDMLPNYGGKMIELPNFKRLEKKTVTFDKSYVCSLPCMPARRELHTGRANFLHRSWGPLEPFDDSMPEILKQNGIYSCLVTDHNHYLEDGGGTYHPRYSTWECNRGQEGDPWKGSAAPAREYFSHAAPFLENMHPHAKSIIKPMYNQDELNRTCFREMADYPQAKTFAQGIEFIQNNEQYDNWFLQIETFDPHEPFDSPDEFIAKVFDPDTVSDLDWPPYAPVKESQEVVDEVRKKYLALLAFCDYSLGQVLDYMDAYDMWKDTMLIVNTDHGFLLGEHGWWAKSMMPDYQEIAHTPLFIWDPRSGIVGERRQSLVQTIDIAPTLLDFFGLEIPKDMIGKPLRQVVQEDIPVRECGIFGAHGGPISITDGRYVLMIAPKENNMRINEYTLMPTRMRNRMSVGDMQQAKLMEPFSFTKGCPVLQIPAKTKLLSSDLAAGEMMLFDVQEDPGQIYPIENEKITLYLKDKLTELLKENDAPQEIIACYM